MSGTNTALLDRPGGPPPRPPRLWLGVRAVAEVLLTIGVLLAFWVVYQFYGVAAQVPGIQRQLAGELQRDWHTDTAPLAEPTVEGTPFARLTLPTLGMSWTVVEGVAKPDLRGTLGHYPGTAMPGEIGDFAVAGHRIHGIFWDLDTLQPGDTVTVETQHEWFTYQVYATEIVVPTDLAVIAPTPDQPTVAPTAAMLTLTTCNPKFFNYQRLIVHARLTGTRAK